jgi:DNA-binding NarL/FixJ family response regulator
MIRVMLVDDHDFVRSAMSELINGADDLRVVGEAENGAEALPTARRTAPEVVLMDLSMPVMNGIDATRELVAELPSVRVIVLTTSVRTQDVCAAAAAGAVGFIGKGADPDDVLAAIRSAGKGETAWDRRSSEILRQAC